MRVRPPEVTRRGPPKGHPVNGPGGGFLSRFKPFPSPLRVLGNFILYNVAGAIRRKPLLPRAMCLYVTYRCNLRCRMCGIWRLPEAAKGNEWSVSGLEDMVADRLFSRLEFVNLNGGEPNLRSDLVEIAGVLVDRLPHLRNLTLNTNGLPSGRCIDNCRRILALCQPRGIRFGVSVSLHRIGSAYDEIAGVPDAYRKVASTLEGLEPLRRERGFYLSTNCVLTPQSLSGAQEMLQWGIERGMPVNFTVAEARERFNNLDAADDVVFTGAEERSRLGAFLRRLAKEKKLAMHHALRYRELAEMVDRGGPRTLACHYAIAGLIVGWDGSIFYCKKSAPVGNAQERSASEVYFDPANLAYRSRDLIERSCASCLPNTFNSMEVQKDLLKLVTLLR